MSEWKEYIKKLNNEYVGKKVNYDGSVYTIVKVDFNGAVHIDRPGNYTETTAVYMDYEVKKYLAE